MTVIRAQHEERKYWNIIGDGFFRLLIMHSNMNNMFKCGTKETLTWLAHVFIHRKKRLYVIHVFYIWLALIYQLSRYAQVLTRIHTHTKDDKAKQRKKCENKVMNWIETRCCGRWCVSGRRECYEWNMLLVTGYELILKCFSISILVVAQFFSYLFSMLLLTLFSCTRYTL